MSHAKFRSAHPGRWAQPIHGSRSHLGPVFRLDRMRSARLRSRAADIYSPYVGAVVDITRILSNIHTAEYQYIPALALPKQDN